MTTARSFPVGGVIFGIGIVMLVGVLVAMAVRSAPPDRKSIPGAKLTPVVVNVDGRRVPCVVADTGFGGGISCDWGSE